jgi:dipeptidase E
MRAYLSSYRLGRHPEVLLRLLDGKIRTALIFNAADTKSDNERASSVKNDLLELTNLGLEPTEVDLRNYFTDSAGLRELLGSFDLIWVRGGNCFIARRAFAASGADRVIKDLLERDEVVYGGFSAGIDMLVPSLHGAELVDDPNLVPAGYNPAIIWDCLGLLPYMIAPHYKSDHPESADIDKTVEYLIEHHLPFIALKDGEAIVIDGDSQYIAG